MSLFLGGGGSPDEAAVEDLAAAFSGCLHSFLETGATVHLLAAAAALEQAGGWRDLRAAAPWSSAASAVVRTARSPGLSAPVRRALLDLAAALLEARGQLVRGITPQRILDGLLVRHLGGLVGAVNGAVAGA